MKRYKIIKRDLVWTFTSPYITTKDESARPSGRLVIVDFEATENARIFHKESERLLVQRLQPCVAGLRVGILLDGSVFLFEDKAFCDDIC